MVFGSGGRKRLEALIDDLAGSYLGDDPWDSERRRDEVCRQITEVAIGLMAAGQAKVIARARTHRPEAEAWLSRAARRNMRYVLARALSQAGA